MTFSKKFCNKSPFKKDKWHAGKNFLPKGPGVLAGHIGISYARESIARNMDEKNKEKLTEDYKKSLIKKAERKEKKIAKKLAKGSTWGVKRKKRKADRLRKRASEVTEEDVLRMREQNRRDPLF